LLSFEEGENLHDDDGAEQADDHPDHDFHQAEAGISMDVWLTY
jgi:hypothetical protein